MVISKDNCFVHLWPIWYCHIWLTWWLNYHTGTWRPINVNIFCKRENMKMVIMSSWMQIWTMFGDLNRHTVRKRFKIKTYDFQSWNGTFTSVHSPNWQLLRFCGLWWNDHDLLACKLRNRKPYVFILNHICTMQDNVIKIVPTGAIYIHNLWFKNTLYVRIRWKFTLQLAK